MSTWHEEQHPREKGRFASKAYPDAGQIALDEPNPYESSPLSEVDIFDRDVSADEAAARSSDVDEAFAARVGAKLSRLSPGRAQAVAAKVWRAAVVSEFFAQDPMNVGEALDHQPWMLEDVDVDAFRDADGLDHEAAGEAASDFWSFEAHSVWSNAAHENAAAASGGPHA